MDMSENRVLVMGLQTKIDLCIASHQDHDIPGKGILDLVPMSLNSDEITSIHLHVSNLTEAVSPSWDALSKGRRAARSTLRAIGFDAAAMGDVVTAENVASYFREDRLSPSGWLASALIHRQLRKQEKMEISSTKPA